MPWIVSRERGTIGKLIELDPLQMKKDRTMEKNPKTKINCWVSRQRGVGWTLMIPKRYKNYRKQRGILTLSREVYQVDGKIAWPLFFTLLFLAWLPTVYTLMLFVVKVCGWKRSGNNVVAQPEHYQSESSQVAELD